MSVHAQRYYPETSEPRPWRDAFGRTRVSLPETLFDSKQLVDKQPLFWDDALVSGSGGATNATTVTGGTKIDGGYGQAQQTGETVVSTSRDFKLGSSIAGVADQLVLAVQRVTGTTETFFGSLTWREDT